MIGFIIFLGFLYACYFIYKVSKGLNEDREWGRQQAIAEAIQQGKKPLGEPFGQQFGSAYLMTPQQICVQGIGMSPEDFFHHQETGDLGFLLFGTTEVQGTDNGVVNILNGPGHVLTVAPTRSGKGTCAVIPNLLNYAGSVIVNDIKGENYAVTRRWRRAIGHAVYKVAPFSDQTAFWNPFDILAESNDAWDDARRMAELLILDAPGKDDFWNNGARNLLTGLILYVHQLNNKARRTLSHLRALLTQDQEDFELTLAEMANCDNKIVARTANVFLRSDIKVQSGILSTLDSELSFLDSERLSLCTQLSDFSFKDLKRKQISIYLIIPPERLRTYAAFLRLFMGMATLELKRTKAKPKYPVLLMMDEFPALGRMKVIEDEISYLAGYGVRLWLFAQDLKQLTAIYGESAQSIIANCIVKQFFGVTDYDTAQLVSHMCGNTTIPHVSVSNATNANTETSTRSIGNSTRSLYDPNEVMSIHPNHQFLFYQGQQPVLSAKVNYLEADKLFVYNGRKSYDKNPYH